MKTNQTLANECLTLANFCRYTYDGESVISGAFDCYHDDFTSLDYSKTYNFSIDIKDETLVLSIDAYSVANEFTKFTSETWDDDAYCSQKIEVTASPVSRENFHALARAARALINGRSVTWSDGTVTPAIERVGSMKTFSVRITLADGTVHTRQVTASSVSDLYNQMQAIAKQYPNYVRSEGSMVKEFV